MSGEQWGEAVERAFAPIPGEHRRAYYDALLAGRAEAARLGYGLIDDRIFAAFHRALYRPMVELIVADTRRKVAAEIEASADGYDGSYVDGLYQAAAIARGSGNGDSTHDEETK